MTQNLTQASQALQISKTGVVSDTRRLDDLKTQNNKTGLKQVSQEFEALFLQMALKSMRDASQSMRSDLNNSNSQKIYEEMYHNQLALHLSKQDSLGLSEAIAKQFEKSIVDYSENIENARQVPIQTPMQKSVLQKNMDSPISTGIQKQYVDLEQQDFIEAILPHLKQAGQALNNLDPHLLLAQCALETGWGKHVAANNNLFGIKADSNWSGDKSRSNTQEFIENQYQNTAADFRSYASKEASIQDYIEFIKNNPRYKEALSCAQNPEQYIRKLQAAGYATDPEYANKVMSIYSQYRRG